MLPQSARKEQGQALIYVTIVMFLLIAIAALAIDVGYSYSERRRMQNAADAGALAGAQELCLNRTAVQAWQKAVDYATLNGTDPAGRNSLAAPDVNVDTTTGIVRVAVTETAHLFLAPAVGVGQMTVPAKAAAACQAAESACGLWPIGFNKSTFENLINTGQCGRTMYIWTGDHDDTTGELLPTPTPEPGATPVPEWGLSCSQCNCDVNNDGKIEVFTDVARAWLDFSGATSPTYPDTCTKNGCGASELACWIRSGEGGKIILPSCVSGDSGVKGGLKNPINDRKNSNIAVPLFDQLDCSPTTGNCPTGPNAHAYRINGFGCVRTTGTPWKKNMTLEWLPGVPHSPGAKCMKGDFIEVQLNCDQTVCNTGCGQSGGGPGDPSHVNAVHLIPVP